PSRRREMVDEAATQLRSAAAADLAEYDRALRQRNAFLKMPGRDEITLDVWDERLSQAGGRVMARRAAAMAELGPYIEEAYRAISGSTTTLSFSYQSEWGGSTDITVTAGEQAERLAEMVRRRRTHDMERRITS